MTLCTQTHTSTDLDGSAYDHDGVVQRSLRLLRELFRSAPQDDGARLRPRTALQEVIPTDTDVRVSCHDGTVHSGEDGQKIFNSSLLPLSSNLDLLEDFTLSQDVVCQGSYRGLDGATAGLEVTLHTVSLVQNSFGHKKYGFATQMD